MKNKKIIFFTFRDFSKFGGGLIRINGVLNSVAGVAGEVILISNISDKEKKNLNDNIKHIHIGLKFSVIDKKLFQFLLSALPFWMISLFFYKKISKLRFLFKEHIPEEEIIFFEYLDISIGYLLKKNNLIKNYICDVHGLVPSEFKQKNKSKTYNYIKYLSAFALDKKVFSNANGIIFASNAMRNFFYKTYPKTINKKFVLLPYFISKETCEFSINKSELSNIKNKYHLKPLDKIIFFAGGFKTLGGVTDLVKAFSIVSKKLDNTKLFLIGEGEELNNIKKIIKENKLEERVILAGVITYSELRTYQEIADIIVCPDRQNIYSNLILHLKYVDSLVSNKIVINGEFLAIKEVNIDEKLSINFIPSNVNSLANKIIYAIQHNEELAERYSNNDKYVRENLLYENNSNILLNFVK
jgi:glycosyltransferase involved in cell wall biosynthesis